MDRRRVLLLVAAIIAAGTGAPGDEATEAASGRLGIDEQADLLANGTSTFADGNICLRDQGGDFGNDVALVDHVPVDTEQQFEALGPRSDMDVGGPLADRGDHGRPHGLDHRPPGSQLIVPGQSLFVALPGLEAHLARDLAVFFVVRLRIGQCIAQRGGGASDDRANLSLRTLSSEPGTGSSSTM